MIFTGTEVDQRKKCAVVKWINLISLVIRLQWWYSVMAGNEESQISARKYPEEEVEHICQLLPGHGFLGDKIKTNRYTSKDIKDVADQLEAKHLQQTTGTADPKPRTLVNLNRKEKNAGLRIDLQGVIQVGR